MTDQSLPTEVRRLLDGPIRTVGHLDVLFALERASPAPRAPGELAGEVGLPPGPVVRRCVNDLVRGGLVARLGEADAYRYEPRSDVLRARVEALAHAYRTRRLVLLRALYRHLA